MTPRKPRQRAGVAQDRDVPLARLVSMALRSLIDKLHERLRDRGFDDVRAAYAFVLLATRDQPMTGSEVGELMGMTKQAASKLVDAMEAAGYLAREPDPLDGRQKRLAIAARGKRLLTTAEDIYLELEREWALVLGEDRLAALRDDLSRVLRALHGGELPPIKPTW